MASVFLSYESRSWDKVPVSGKQVSSAVSFDLYSKSIKIIDIKLNVTGVKIEQDIWSEPKTGLLVGVDDIYWWHRALFLWSVYRKYMANMPEYSSSK